MKKTSKELGDIFSKYFNLKISIADSDQPVGSAFLNPQDLTRYQSIKSAKTKLDFLIGRNALYSFFNQPEDCSFKSTSHKYLSVTHCNHQAYACKIEGSTQHHAVGLDFQQPKADLAPAQHLFLNNADLKLVNESNDLLVLWTVKEASFKSMSSHGDFRLTAINIKEREGVYTRLQAAGSDQQSIIIDCYSVSLPSGVLSLAISRLPEGFSADAG